MKKSLQFVLIFVFIISIIMTGCKSDSGNSSDKDSKALKAIGKDEKTSIKVMYYDEKSFDQQYGNLFASKFPNIEVKVVSTQVIYQSGKNWMSEFDKLVEAEKPDVLMLNLNQYEKMAADGNLLELGPVIRKDKFDIENILPAVKDLLTSKGNGKLYGLSPTFYSSALLYNKDLFDQYGVPYPKDQMSWDEVLKLAKRFPIDGSDDQRIYGFFINNSGNSALYPMASLIAASEELSFVDAENLKVTIQNDNWKRVYQTSLDMIKSIANHNPKTDASGTRTMEDNLRADLFATGRAAMTLGSYGSLNTIEEAEIKFKDIKPFNWDLVTVPVNPKKPDETSSFFVNPLFAINAQSTQQNAAWELMKYINSDEFAKIQSRSTQVFLSRTDYIKEKNGHNLEAFYKLKPKTTNQIKGANNIPTGFLYPTFNKLLENEMQPVLDGKRSLDDALQTIQDKGQQALDQAVADANAKK